MIFGCRVANFFKEMWYIDYSFPVVTPPSFISCACIHVYLNLGFVSVQLHAQAVFLCECTCVLLCTFNTDRQCQSTCRSRLYITLLQTDQLVMLIALKHQHSTMGMWFFANLLWSQHGVVEETCYKLRYYTDNLLV